MLAEANKFQQNHTIKGLSYSIKVSFKIVITAHSMIKKIIIKP